MERVRELTDGEGADVVVDVTAVSVQPITDAVEIAKPGATIIIAGVKGSSATIPNLVSDKLLIKELTIKGVWSQDLRAFEPALRSSNRANVRSKRCIRTRSASTKSTSPFARWPAGSRAKTQFT